MYTIDHLSHTADIRLLLRADSREELFRAGFEAMNEIIKPGACRMPCPCIVTQTIEIASVDDTTLLIDFLSDVLTLAHEHKAVFCELNFLEMNANKLKASIGGRPANGFEEDIKAVTYHEANVRQNTDGKWETFLIFDI
ncbi:MAG: archease [Phaeodactylibacter sp.]|nr:archease [Phaeodactylibacter sp.]